MADVDGQSGGEAPEEQFLSLYRRFRPGRFAELRGQPHVVRALQGAVRDARVAHAYLLSGPRGTGKTSSARILARALNCADPVDGEPCGVCSSCVEIARGTSMDVHELDAASNNGVDAMRELISHAALATPGRWKVYIVDEVHMLSNAAANALLKTLEEPPSHVVFVLATTDPQKVPPTIRSRTQHFEFGLLGADTLAELVHDVNTAAGLSLSEVDLTVAVRKGRGSARDTLSALDQVAASGGSEGLQTDVAELVEAFCEEDARRALVGVATLAEAGWGPQQLTIELVDELRQAFLASLAPELATAGGPELERLSSQAGRLGLPRLVRAMETLGKVLVDMRDAPDPRAVLEVALVRLCRPELDDSTSALLDRLARLEQAVAGGAVPRVAGATPTPAPAAASTPAAAPAPSVPGPVALEGPVESRPALGALLRQRAAPAPDSAATPSAVPAAAVPAATTDVDARSAPVLAVAAPTPASAPTAAADLDRDTVVEAWGDHILRGLQARAKAVYAAGRFVSVEGDVATFALPNAAHRDRCEDARRTVEDAMSAYFGSKVTLRLTVDDGAASPAGNSRSATPARQPSGRREAPPDDDLDPGDAFDPAEVQTGSVDAMVQARVLEAFPGAEEVTS